MRRLGVIVFLGVVGCAVQPRGDLGVAADGGMQVDAASSEDRDHDGVCDVTEQTVGSNADALDSDHDGFPDAVELINGFDPVDPNSPGIDQVGFLPAKNGASYQFDVRATVDGEGESYTGSLSSYPSLDPDNRTADDFFAGAVAVGAEPPENVRGLDASAERFDAVVGHTRLSFSARFEYKTNVDFECAQGFSFAYELKTDQGDHTGSRDYMLVIVPKDSTGRDPKSFCLPAACL